MDSKIALTFGGIVEEFANAIADNFRQPVQLSLKIS